MRHASVRASSATSCNATAARRTGTEAERSAVVNSSDLPARASTSTTVAANEATTVSALRWRWYSFTISPLARLVAWALADFLQPVAELLADIAHRVARRVECGAHALGVVLPGRGRLLARCRLLAAAHVVAGDDAVVLALAHPLQE